jgi:hypothetical protein
MGDGVKRRVGRMDWKVIREKHGEINSSKLTLQIMEPVVELSRGVALVTSV